MLKGAERAASEWGGHLTAWRAAGGTLRRTRVHTDCSRALPIDGRGRFAGMKRVLRRGARSRRGDPRSWRGLRG
jgi:hypothetical protein